jgi:2-polyprenyl-6-methoxyphenol hydroxylase-like FAD-dependent oxidoreductase
VAVNGGSAHVIVIGAGVAGLGGALALSRAGHQVTLIERDATPLPADPDAAFEWDRRGAPQVRHSHALLARLRNLLRDRYPDVLASLLEAGATEIHFAENLPPEITDRDARPGDDDLVAIACRRTTFEWVLRRAVLASADVTLLDGTVAESLQTAPADRAGAPPVVTGVNVAQAGQNLRLLSADLVIAAVGRRSAVPRLLSHIGVDPSGRSEDTGIIYLSRFYRLRPEAEPPPDTGPIGGDLGYLKYAVFQGDNRSFSVTFAVGTHDDELRVLLVEADGFDRAARALSATAAWVEPDRAEAITEVHVMGGLLNRRLDFVDDGGEPIVLGFHAIGDAHTCTNPLYGRGCSLAMVQATLLADALTDHPDDPRARAQAYETASEREVRPWYAAAVAQDRMNKETGHENGRETGRKDARFGDVLRDGLAPALRTDARVFRAFVRTFNLLDPPDTLVTDPDIVGRILAAYEQRHQRPPEPPLGPRRAELVDQLSLAGSDQPDQPPATACMIETVPPSGTGVPSPSMNRTSSSSTNTLT